MSSRRRERCGERTRQLRAGGRGGGAPVQVSEPVNLPLAPHVNVALDVPPVQPGSHVALHDCPVVSVPLQPEVCGGEGAVPLHWLAVAQVGPVQPLAQSHVPLLHVPPCLQAPLPVQSCA